MDLYYFFTLTIWALNAILIKIERNTDVLVFTSMHRAYSFEFNMNAEEENKNEWE